VLSTLRVVISTWLRLLTNGAFGKLLARKWHRSFRKGKLRVPEGKLRCKMGTTNTGTKRRFKTSERNRRGNIRHSKCRPAWTVRMLGADHILNRHSFRLPDRAFAEAARQRFRREKKRQSRSVYNWRCRRRGSRTSSSTKRWVVIAARIPAIRTNDSAASCHARLCQ